MTRAFSARALASNVAGATLAVLFFSVFELPPALAQEQEASPADLAEAEETAEEAQGPDQLVLSSSERVRLVNRSLQLDEERLVQLARDLVKSRRNFEHVSAQLEKVSLQIEARRAELPSEPEGESTEEVEEAEEGEDGEARVASEAEQTSPEGLSQERTPRSRRRSRGSRRGMSG